MPHGAGLSVLSSLASEYGGSTSVIAPYVSGQTLLRKPKENALVAL